MCGIIGYLSTEPGVSKKIIHNLKKLEYRGYDSSGICLLKNTKFFLKKSVGEIQNLEQKLKFDDNCTLGIAHTRWATHGKVSLKNTHPHLSQDHSWAVVHNGIIENYLELKSYLESHGVTLSSETDTEIIPNLMATYDNADNIEKLKQVTCMLRGSYAICLLHKGEQAIYVARRHSPLYIAQNKTSCMVSSDPVTFGEDFDSYYALPDACLAKVDLKDILVYDSNLNKINIRPCEIGSFEKSAELGKYNYYAEKEISEIPKVVEEILLNYNTVDHFKKINKEFMKNIKKIKLIGCGTAYHACLMGAKYIQKDAQIEAQAEIASEFRYSNPLIDQETLCIFLSQSGETADTLLSLELAKNMGAKTIAIVNVPYSSIARQADIVLPLCAGMEVAVMSTKAYNAMLTVLKLLSQHFRWLDGKPKNVDFSKLKKVNYFKSINKIDEISDLVLKHEKIFFIGRAEDYVTALEAGLKLKEITYINCVSIPSGELKHGTLSLVDQKSLVFVIATDPDLVAKNLSSASEIKARGGKIVLVTNLDVKSCEDIDYLYKFDETEQALSSLLSVIPFQVLSYKTCVKLGFSPDKPRNLAKSVTVE